MPIKNCIMVYISIFFLILTTNAQELPATSQHEDWECPPGFEGKTLNVLGWFGYLDEERYPLTVSDFETSCGIELNYTTYDDEYFLLDTIRLGNQAGYDLLILSGTIVNQLRLEGLAIEIDGNLVFNRRHIAPAFLNTAYDPDNAFSVPYLWGSVGIAYRKDIFPNGIASWEEVWQHDGSVVWLNDHRAMLGIALQYLGYNPNSTDADEITEARDFLANHIGNVADIYLGDVSEILRSESADIVITYSNNIARWLQACECETYGFTIPAEGSNIYVDNLLVPVGSSNPELAMAFMNYILQPTVNARISNLDAGSTNATAAELNLIDERLSSEIGFNPPDDILSRMFFIDILEEHIASFYQLSWDDLLFYYEGN